VASIASGSSGETRPWDATSIKRNKRRTIEPSWGFPSLFSSLKIHSFEASSYSWGLINLSFLIMSWRGIRRKFAAPSYVVSSHETPADNRKSGRPPLPSTGGSGKITQASAANERISSPRWRIRGWKLPMQCLFEGRRVEYTVPCNFFIPSLFHNWKSKIVAGADRKIFQCLKYPLMMRTKSLIMKLFGDPLSNASLIYRWMSWSKIRGNEHPRILQHKN